MFFFCVCVITDAPLQERVKETLKPHPPDGPDAYELADYFRKEWLPESEHFKFKRFASLVKAYIKKKTAAQQTTAPRETTALPPESAKILAPPAVLPQAAKQPPVNPLTPPPAQPLAHTPQALLPPEMVPPPPPPAAGPAPSGPPVIPPVNVGRSTAQKLNRPLLSPPRCDKGKNKMVAATKQAQKTQKGILPNLKPPKVIPAGPAVKGLVSTTGAPTANTAAASAEITRVAEPGGGHTVHFPPGLFTIPGGIRSSEKVRDRRNQVKTPSVVASSDDEADGDEYRPMPPPVQEEQEEQKPPEMARLRYEEKTKELEENGYSPSPQACSACIRSGFESWRPNPGAKKARSRSACLFCANGIPNEPDVGGGMSLAMELGELTRYFRRGSEGQFPAPGPPLEDDVIPENVDQLLVATLVAIRSLQEEQ